MYCSNCGTSNDQSNKFCQNCGAALGENSDQNVQMPQNNYNQNTNENNNMNQPMPSFSSGHSIFLIIFSFLCCGGIIGAIFAILSLVEGNKVNDYAAAGDYNNAVKCKKASEKWIKATYITWAIVAALMIIYFAFVFFVAIVSEM